MQPSQRPYVACREYVLQSVCLIVPSLYLSCAPCAAPGSGGMGVRLVWPLVCHHAVWCAPRSHRCRGEKWRKDKKMGTAKKNANSNARITYVVLQY